MEDGRHAFCEPTGTERAAVEAVLSMERFAGGESTDAEKTALYDACIENMQKARAAQGRAGGAASPYVDGGFSPMRGALRDYLIASHMNLDDDSLASHYMAIEIEGVCRGDKRAVLEGFLDTAAAYDWNPQIPAEIYLETVQMAADMRYHDIVRRGLDALHLAEEEPLAAIALSVAQSAQLRVYEAMFALMQPKPGVGMFGEDLVGGVTASAADTAADGSSMADAANTVATVADTGMGDVEQATMRYIEALQFFCDHLGEDTEKLGPMMLVLLELGRKFDDGSQEHAAALEVAFECLRGALKPHVDALQGHGVLSEQQRNLLDFYVRTLSGYAQLLGGRHLFSRAYSVFDEAISAQELCMGAQGGQDATSKEQDRLVLDNLKSSQAIMFDIVNARMRASLLHTQVGQASPPGQ